MEQRTLGKIRLSVQTASDVGPVQQILEALSLGSHAVLVSPITGSASSGLTAYDLTQLPYLFRDSQHVDRVVCGPIGDAWADRHLSNTHRRVFGYITRPSRQVIFNRDVTQPEDVHGLRLRATTSPILSETWRTFGALQIPGSGELPLARLRGLVDGLDASIDEIVTTRAWEAYARLVLTSHAAELSWGQVSGQMWEELTPETQRLWVATWREIVGEIRPTISDRVRAALSLWTSRGGKVVEPDPEPWRLASAGVWKRFAPSIWGAGVYERVQDA
jgi:TRAP-type C4-dicarboxylate transport system substrate-binding protein